MDNWEEDFQNIEATVQEETADAPKRRGPCKDSMDNNGNSQQGESKPKDVKREDVEKFLNRLDELVALTDTAMKKLEEGTSNTRKPRGVRSTLPRIERLNCVLQATKAIADIFAIGTQASLNAFDKGKILKAYKMKNCQIENLFKKFDAKTDEMLQALADENDDEADSAARELHKLGLSLDYTSETFADAIRESTHYFPEENEQLQLFSYLNMLEDSEMIERIDRTMRLTGYVEVAVADAPLLMKAMRSNDKQSISSIFQSAFEAKA